MENVLPRMRDSYIAKYYNEDVIEEFSVATDPGTYVANYSEISEYYMQEDGAARLREILLKETSFEGRTFLAYDYILACFSHPTEQDSIELALGFIEKLLTSGQYSPNLPFLWRVWRCEMQMHISPSNDGDIANDHYETMRTRVAETILRHIAKNPDDKAAKVIFLELTTYPFILRQGSLIGNLATIEEMELLWAPTYSDDDE